MKDGMQSKVKQFLQKAKANAEKYVLPWWRKLCARLEPVIEAGKQKSAKAYCASRDWTCAQWQSGRNGRIKVLAVGGGLLLVIGAVLSLVGLNLSMSKAMLSKQGANGKMASVQDSGGKGKSSENNVYDDEKALLDALAQLKKSSRELDRVAALLSGRIPEGQEEEVRGWLCSYKDCCAVFYSPTKPYGRMGGPCGHGREHFWTEKGSAGSTIYRCRHCGLVMHMSETPWSGAECPRGASHFWVKE